MMLGRLGRGLFSSQGFDVARGPLRGILVMSWGMSLSSNIRRLLQVPKTDTPFFQSEALSCQE